MSMAFIDRHAGGPARIPALIQLTTQGTAWGQLRLPGRMSPKPATPSHPWRGAGWLGAVTSPPCGPGAARDTRRRRRPAAVIPRLAVDNMVHICQLVRAEHLVREEAAREASVRSSASSCRCPHAGVGSPSAPRLDSVGLATADPESQIWRCSTISAAGAYRSRSERVKVAGPSASANRFEAIGQPSRRLPFGLGQALADSATIFAAIRTTHDHQIGCDSRTLQEYQKRF